MSHVEFSVVATIAVAFPRSIARTAPIAPILKVLPGLLALQVTRGTQLLQFLGFGIQIDGHSFGTLRADLQGGKRGWWKS